MAKIHSAARRLSNHSFLVVKIDGSLTSRKRQWQSASSAMLFAEKFNRVKLNDGFFRPKVVAKETLEAVSSIDEAAACFEEANVGLYYRDCFVIDNSTTDKAAASTQRSQTLYLIFEKNEADTDRIPCPACRSLDVKGNSYPTLGVRSWECDNDFCPNRSLFNRGNRFAAPSIIRQNAIENAADQIPQQSISDWRLDFVRNRQRADALSMLIRHYTMSGETVIVDTDDSPREVTINKRLVRYAKIEANDDARRLARSFRDFACFRRFLTSKSTRPVGASFTRESLDKVEIICGDCRDLSYRLPESSFDGAVTSPPYYNAREYSQWANFYTYLHDMQVSAEAMFQVLKPGAFYLFNVFDYYDNDRTIAFSAMGKRRLTLSAHLSAVFEHVGFSFEGAVPWFKGHIEGKRNFNNGNRSPFYQRPHNTWEHILIFQKPGATLHPVSFPPFLSEKPVMKIVGGRNTLGHTAPFPVAIPDLLFSQLPEGSSVIDPFAGSMTSGLSALKFGLRSTMVERNPKYVRVGVERVRGFVESRIRESVKEQPLLFGDASV